MIKQSYNSTLAYKFVLIDSIYLKFIVGTGNMIDKCNKNK